MLKLSEIVEKLQDRNLSEVARRTGLNRGVVWSVARGYTENPYRETQEKLSDYLEAQK